MPTTEREKWIGQFISGKLRPLLGSDGRERDAAILARLRRCAGKNPTTALEEVGRLFEHVPDGYRSTACFENTLDTATLTASLFALWHQGNRATGERSPSSLGASFKLLADDERRRSGLKASDPVPNIERRFAALLDSHPDDLPKRLRHTVSLLSSKSSPIPIDWARLLSDLLNWNAEARFVQRQWARDFWIGRSANGTVVAEVGAEPVTTRTTSNLVLEETDDDS